MLRVPSIPGASLRLSVLLGILGALLFVASASALQPGSIVVTEVMADPTAIADSVGEWIELYNPHGDIADLRGVQVSRDGDPDVFTIAGPSPIPLNAGEYFVLAASADSGANGGITPDQEYSEFVLINSGSTLRVADTTGQISAATYALPVAGASSELVAITSSFEGTLQAQTLGFPYGPTPNLGTPGVPNVDPLPPIPPPPVPVPTTNAVRVLLIVASVGIALSALSWRSGRARTA